MSSRHIRSRSTWRAIRDGGLLALVLAVKSEAQVLSPCTAFQSTSTQDLATLEVKLTFVGPTRDGVSTVAFTSPSNSVHVGLFAPYRRPDFSYSADDISVHTFAATTGQLKGALDAALTIPAVQAGGVSDPPYLSFSLLNTAGGTKVCEAVLDQAQTTELLTKLQAALQANANGMRYLRELSCAIGAIDSARPSDVSSDVAVSLTGVRLNRTTGRFVGLATVANKSANNISGPVSIVFLKLSPGIRVFNPAGTTCGTSPSGRPFIDLALPANTLAGGTQTQLPLEFENPDNLPVQVATKVLAGPGVR